MFKWSILKKEEVIDSWSVLIENGQGKAEEIFNNTSAFLAKSKAPNVKVERKKVAPGFFRGLLGGAKRDFLVIRETGNPNLSPYEMFIGVRDYGNNLDVSWYLTYRLGFFRLLLTLLLLLPGIGILFLPYLYLFKTAPTTKERVLDLDLFDEQDLIAYVTNAHHCLLEAVQKLIIDLGQDPSKMERKSRGFLGIT